MLQEIRLPPVVLEREPELRVVGGDDVLSRPGEEPEQRAELHDHEQDREHQLDAQQRRVGEEAKEAFDDVPSADHEQDSHEQQSQHDQPSSVLLEHVSEGGHSRANA